MDIAARYYEAQSITNLFRKFDSRGLDVYAIVAGELFDALDQADGRWLDAINATLRELRDLNAVAHWVNPVEGAAVSAQIADLSAKYIKRAAALVDLSALAADAYASLTNITGAAGQERIEELRAAGVSQRRIDTLYPFNINEHLPMIAKHALHGPQTEKIAALLRGADPMIANSFFAAKPAQHISRTAHDYLRATYGPWQSGVSSPYENVVDAWAYLLALMHGVAQQGREAEGARTKLAKVMKQQCSVARELVRLTSI